MTDRTVIETLRDGWRRFCRAQRGNVTITFGLAFIPLIGLVGAAVDYSHANTIRTAMQSAADAAALSISKTATTMTAADIQSKASDYFKAVFTRTDAKNLQITATYTGSPTKVVIGATATMDTSIMGVLGFSQMPLRVSSTTTWGQTRLRVALVLDNTGSMSSSGKLTALKTATKNLLTQLQNAATTSADVYVSIIPFVKDIAVDSTNYSSNWVYWGTSTQDPTLSDDSSWDANNGNCSSGNASSRSKCFQNSCSISGYTNKSSCTSNQGCTNPLQTTQSACTGQRACSLPYSSQNSCSNHHGTWGYGNWQLGVWNDSITWTPKNHNTWNGCITDRGDSSGPNSGNYDTNVVTPTTGATLFPAEQYGSCPETVMPLNNNWSTMTTAVNNMTANGNTNQAIGLAHGWLSLVGGGPYPTPPAIDSNYNYQKVIILLTDGLNTQNRWTSNAAQIDAREQLTCDNVNAAGITLYTVQVNTSSPPDPTSTVLQKCAGSPGKYPDSSKFFLLTSASAIVSTFEQIGTQISKLHVAY